MTCLSEISPQFAKELSDALRTEGYSPLAVQVCEARIERWTFDSEADAGYIYFERLMPHLVAALHKEATPVAKTISFASPHWFNVDVDHEGNPFGVELLGRADVIVFLQSAKAL
jgi:uncharacterized protein YuzE